MNYCIKNRCAGCGAPLPVALDWCQHCRPVTAPKWLNRAFFLWIVILLLEFLLGYCCAFGSEKVSWTYPPHGTNIVFQVFSTTNGQRGDMMFESEMLAGQGAVTNATGFELFATTGDTFLVVSNSDQQRFFAVRAYDYNTKTYSAWAVHK